MQHNPKDPLPRGTKLYQVCGKHIQVHTIELVSAEEYQGKDSYKYRIESEEEARKRESRKGGLYIGHMPAVWHYHINHKDRKTWYTSLDDALKELRNRLDQRKVKLENDLFDTIQVIDKIEDTVSTEELRTLQVIV